MRASSYDTLTRVLFALPDETLVYPGAVPANRAYGVVPQPMQG